LTAEWEDIQKQLDDNLGTKADIYGKSAIWDLIALSQNYQVIEDGVAHTELVFATN